jgi:hypothetical protein
VDAPAGINITGSCATTLPTLMAKNQTVGAEVRPTDRQSRGSEGLCAAKMGLTKPRAQIFGSLTRALALAFLGRVSTLRDTFLAKNPGRGL